MKNKLLEIIDNFSKKRVLIVGDLMLDEYKFGVSTRLSPEAPVPVVEIEKVSYVPGGAANAAFNVRSLGDETILLGIVGNDDNGKKLVSILKKSGINTDGVIIDRKRPTTLKTRIVSGGQQVVRVDYESCEKIPKLGERRIIGYVMKNIKKADIVLISDYNKGVLTSDLVKRIIRLARENGKKVIADPKTDDFSKYSGATVVTPNLKETEAALKLKVDNLSKMFQFAKMLLAHINSEAVLITMSENGMCFAQKNIGSFQLPAPKTNVVDISGAGDTAIATFALCLAAGATMKEAALISSFACGITIGKMGTATATKGELVKAIRDNLFFLPLSI